MGRNYEVFAIVKSDLSNKELAFINKIIEDAMVKYEIKRDKDTFYHEKKLGGGDVPPCLMFAVTLNRYKEYFEFLDYNSYFEGAINVTKEIAGSEYKKLREIRWIPISEGYPNNVRQVLVTYKHENGEYKIGIDEYGNLNEYPEECGFRKLHENVIAWAELPSPYIKEY